MHTTDNPPISDSSPQVRRPSHKVPEADQGGTLWKLCRELFDLLIRRYLAERDLTGLKERLQASLIVVLNCNPSQARCLVDLSIELIHRRVHGQYRRNPAELSYLMATAAGAVENLRSNEKNQLF